MAYSIRYNTAHRGYILISCCYGHCIESVKVTSQFGCSAAESRIASGAHRCRDCESAGMRKAA